MLVQNASIWPFAIRYQAFLRHSSFVIRHVRAVRGELMKRFLVDDGVGQDARFWKLAQSLSALYPPGTGERRWVEGVLARKKGLWL